MIKCKILSIYLIVGMILMGFSILSSQPFMESASAAPDDGIDGYQEHIGDWIVSSYKNYSHEIIALHGDLIIENGGHLVLFNCTVMMMSITLAPYEIIVENGGILELYECYITDPPDDDDTEFLSAYYYLIARADSTLIIEDSTVRQCGFIDVSNPEHMGLYVGTNSGHIVNSIINSSIVALSFSGDNTGFLVENVEISEIGMSPLLMQNTYGVRINNISFQAVGENYLVDSQNSHDFSMENITLTGEQVLRFFTSSGFSVKNINGINCERILRIEDCNDFHIQNIVIDTSEFSNRKIEIDRSSNFEINFFQTSNDNDGIEIEDSQNATVSNIFGTNVTRLLELKNSDNITVNNVNVFEGSDILRLWDCNKIFMDNIVLDDVYSPIHMNATRNSSISNLDIQRLRGIGMDVVFGSRNVSISNVYIESESMEHTRGLWLDSSEVDVRDYSSFNVNLSIDCWKSNLTGENILVNGTYESDSGIEMKFSGDIDLANITVLNPRLYGIRFEDCQDGDVRLNKVFVNDSTVGLYSLRSDAILSDLIFDNCVQDIQAVDDSHLTVMNSTINIYLLSNSDIVAINAPNSSYSPLTGSSSLTCMWWVDVYVTDSKGIVAGAKIDIRDYMGIVEIQSITGPDGYARDVPVIDTIFTPGPNTESKNPHTARAYEIGWEAFSGAFDVFGNMQVNINYIGNTPPNAPTNLVAYSLENSSTILEWDPSTSQDVAWYDIYIAKDIPSLGDYMSLGNPNATSLDTTYIHVSGSEDWQLYFYSVKTNDGASDSARYTTDRCGDWVVNKTVPQIIGNENITLYGSLLVYSNLTIIDTYFQIGSRPGYLYGIFINNSAQFICENVTIARENIEPYFFYIEVDAYVNINGSRIQYPGADTRETEGFLKGIISFSRNLTITNSIIDARFWGLGIYDVQDFLGVLDNITFYSYSWDRGECFFDIHGSSNLKITGLKIFANTNYGIYANDVNSLEVTQSNISLESAGHVISYGIFMHNCQDAIIHNNSLILGNPGIYILGSENVTVENSNISSWEYSAVQAVASRYTTIQRCDFVRTNGRVDNAIYLSWCMYSTIKDIGGGDNDNLIKIDNESHSNIEDVTHTGGEVGIWLVNSDNILLKNIYLEFLQAGMKLTGCYDITLIHVTINLTINCLLMDSPGAVNLFNCYISNGINGEIIAKGYEGEPGVLILNNCTVSSFGEISMILNDSAVVYLINTSVNLSKLQIEDSGSRVELYHYLTVQVYDIDNNIPLYANISIMNSKGYIIYHEQLSSGFAQWILVHDKTIFREDEFTDNPFIIFYDDGSHAGGFETFINNSQHLDVTVSNLLPDIVFIDIMGYYDNPAPEPDYTHQPTTNYDIILNYTYEDPENDPESGTIIHWYINGVYNSTFDDMSTIASQFTQKGQIWQAIIYPSDGYDSTYPEYPFVSNVLPISNTPPSVANVTISPTEPTGGHDLYVDFDVYDLDDDGLDLSKTTIKWYIYNFILGDWEYSNIDSFYLPSLYTIKGHEWKCVVTPHDGDDEGLPVESQVVTIGNTPPSIQNPRITDESGSTILNGADNLRVQYSFSDADFDSESGSAYEWYYQRDGGPWTAVSVNSSILPSSYTQREDLWKCKVIPKDGEDFGVEAWTEAVEIFNTPPQVSNVTILPQYATSEDSLTVTYDYYDYDGDPENGTSFSWVYEDALGSKDSGIHGNVTPYGALVKDQVWYCFVIPSDGINVGQEIRSEGMLIHNSPPYIDEAQVQIISTDSDRHLWLSYTASDIDLDPVESVEIRWFKNGNPELLFNDNQTVSGDNLDKGDSWYAEISVYDGAEWSEVYTTQQTTIPNTAPFINGTPTLSESKVLSNQTLLPMFENLFQDEDADALVSFEIKWYKNNGHMEDYDDLEEISWELTQKDEIWYYKVRVSDGEDFSEWYSSTTTVIENSPPSNIIQNPTEIEITFTETETKEFNVSASDIDGDPLSYRWTLDGRIVLLDEGVGTSIYLFKTTYDSEGEYLLRLVVTDGDDSNETTWTVDVEKMNRLPEISVVEPEGRSASIKENENLKFAITKSDSDGDNLDVKWYIDGVLVWEGSDKYTYSPDYASSGTHTITAEVKEVESGANSTYSWDVEVADVGEAMDTFLGINWDLWSIMLEIIVIGGTGLLAFIGYRRIRKKKGALKIYMAEIEEVSAQKEENPQEYEEKLSDLEAKINDEFSQGKIEDLHFLMLQEIIAGQRGEVRRATITRKFGGLPEGILKELDEMLKDGKISREEYDGFVGTISKTKSLSDEEKDELSKMIGEWEVEDKDLIEEESPDKKVEPKETDTKEIKGQDTDSSNKDE